MKNFKRIENLFSITNQNSTKIIKCFGLGIKISLNLLFNLKLLLLNKGQV